MNNVGGSVDHLVYEVKVNAPADVEISFFLLVSL